VRAFSGTIWFSTGPCFPGAKTLLNEPKGDASMIDFGMTRRMPLMAMACAAALGLGSGGVFGQEAKVDAAQSSASETKGLPPIDAGLVNTYRSHIEFLANPFMEGRGPGTRGNAIAAEYVESGFRSLGLTPVIPPRVDADVSEGHGEPEVGFRQQFAAGNNVRRVDSFLTGNPESKQSGTFVHGVDYTVLGFSASTSVTGPLAFVGYAISKGGPDGAYSSFSGEPEVKTLDGKIAMLFRFEPMGEDGKSLWRQKKDGQWSPAAAVAEKINAVVKRGVIGVIIVSPPECADPRSKKLETTEGSARWMRQQDVPVVVMTPEAAERMLSTRDKQRRGIRQLRRAADTDGSPITLNNDPVTLSVELDRSPRKTWNIVGELPGKGERAKEVIVIGAHYDHVGYGYTGGSRSDEYGIVHPGADDNASGTAGLLLAAGELKKRYDAAGPDASLRSIVFVAFSAEEMGLIGSRHFIKHMPFEASATYAMLNMDMIGRLRNDEVEAAGTGTAEGFDSVLDPAFEASGLNVKKSPGGRGPSDHATFYGASVPVLHVFTGLHEEYHTPKDTIDTINFEGGARCAMLIADIAERLAKRAEPLVFKSTDRKKSPSGDKADDQAAGPSMANVKVRFGIAPANYADADAGVGVGEVFPGTSAEEAGIQKDDRLVRWNGKAIEDVENWMTYLAEHKPGDVVDVTIKRKGEEQVVRVTLKSRDQAQR
jgi:hypothetical protein